MLSVKKWDDKIYHALHVKEDLEKFNELWDVLRKNEKLLLEASDVKKDKWNINNTVVAPAICECMLLDAKKVPHDILKKLLSVIYSDVDIAQIVVHGFSNDGFSLLIMALAYHDFILSSVQKAFVEAQLKSHAAGTRRLSHFVLSNPNWSTKEKSRLIFQCFESQESWTEYIDSLEWDIVNDQVNFRGAIFSWMDFDQLYDYKLHDLLEVYGSEDEAKRIMNEINYCFLLRSLRPKFV